MPNASCPRMQFIVKLNRAATTDAWGGSLSIPRGCGIMGAIDVPLKSVVRTPDRISFITPPPPSENAYNAALTPGDPVAKGRLVLGAGQAVEIRMWPVTEEEARNAAPRRPQVPTGELPYRATDVRVPAEAGVDLTGTLSTPAGAGPFPAVVLVGDAEAQDRDHAVGTHKPFLVLADRLTRAGFAVLRCDDRGLGGSGGSCSEQPLESAAADVAAQVTFLRGVKEVDAKRISVIGWGEGALVGALAAGAPSNGVASLVLLNPAGSKGIDVACAREEHQLKATGDDDEYIQSRVSRLRTALTLAMQDGKKAELNDALKEDAKAYEASIRGMGLAMTEDQIVMWAASRADVMVRPRFRSWLATDPAPALRKLSCPVLVITSELDLLMPPATERPLVLGALKQSASKRVVEKSLASTNHWLQPCGTGFDNEVDLIETTISEDALREIIAFLGTR